MVEALYAVVPGQDRGVTMNKSTYLMQLGMLKGRGVPNPNRATQGVFVTPLE